MSHTSTWYKQDERDETHERQHKAEFLLPDKWEGCPGT